MTAHNVPAARENKIRAAHPLRFGSIRELEEIAKALFEGGITPTNVNNYRKLIPMILSGAEIGLSIMQSIKSFTAPINGQCNLWGDAGLALVRASGELLKLEEKIEGSGDDRRAICTIHRVGYEPKTFTYALKLAKNQFSYLKAQKDKRGPWYDDPDNMLTWRARWRAMRTEFTDVLAGFGGVEEEEIETAEVVVRDPVPALPAGSAAATSAPAEISAGVAPGITKDQLEQLAKLKELMKVQMNQPTKEELASKWNGFLIPFKVESAKALDSLQAAELIEALEKVYLPNM